MKYKIIIIASMAVIIYFGGIYTGYKNFKPTTTDTITIDDTTPQVYTITIPVNADDNANLIKRANAPILIYRDIDGLQIHGRATDGYKATAFEWTVTPILDNTSNNISVSYYPVNRLYDVSYLKQWNLYGLGCGVVIKDKYKFSDVRITASIRF
jgi:hypothetical protein